MSKFVCLFLFSNTISFIKTESAICGRKCCVDHMLVFNRCVKCPEGKFGINCAENCIANYFGHGCRSQCNCTKLEFCSSIYGCVPMPVMGCPEGKQGVNCSENCPSDRYGKNCTETCSCEHYQYCQSERGCRNVTIPNDASILVTSLTNTTEAPGLFDNLIGQTWFRIAVISCIGVITIVIIVAIVVLTRKRFKRNERRSESVSTERWSMEDQDDSFPLDLRSDHHTRVPNGNSLNRNQDEVNVYAAMRESSFIENKPKARTVKEKNRSMSDLAQDKNSISNDGRKKMYVKGSKFSGIDNDIVLKENGYHQLNVNYSKESTDKLQNYDETCIPGKSRYRSKDIAIKNSKDKSASKGKKHFSLDRSYPEEYHCAENTYTKTDFRRHKTTKPLSGNVTIISRLSTLLTSKPKPISELNRSHMHSQVTESPGLDSYRDVSQSNDLPPPPRDAQRSEFETGFTETRRNKLGYSLVRGCRLPDSIEDPEPISDSQEATGHFDDGIHNGGKFVQNSHRSGNNYSMARSFNDQQNSNKLPTLPALKQQHNLPNERSMTDRGNVQCRKNYCLAGGQTAGGAPSTDSCDASKKTRDNNSYFVLEKHKM